LQIPLVALGAQRSGTQSTFVCVRNMFEEERIGNPGRVEFRS